MLVLTSILCAGTQVDSASPPEGVEPSAQLTVDLRDLCEDHMRPDYFDMFFPASDSEGEDDLDHLCERLGNLLFLGKFYFTW